MLYSDSRFVAAKPSPTVTATTTTTMYGVGLCVSCVPSRSASGSTPGSAFVMRRGGGNVPARLAPPVDDGPDRRGSA